jgi:hypothetical protein
MADDKADMATAPAAEEGSVEAATDALLTMLDADEAPPAEPDKATPEDSEESQPETEEDTEEEVEADDESDDDDEYEPGDERAVEGDDVPDVFTVKIDGTDTEVTLDELQAGYSRQSDYTKKTQELATERKALAESQQQYAAEIQESNTVREQYVQAIGQFIAQTNSNLGEYAQIDWRSLKENDPLEYVTKRDEFRDHQARIQHAQRLQQNAVQEADAERGKLIQEKVAQEHELMMGIVPEWADAEKRAELAGKIRGYSAEQGFSEQEIEGLMDHRSLNLIIKAMKYDALENGQIKDKKIRNKPRLVKSGTSRTKESVNRKKRGAQINKLKETGSYKDAAKLLEDLL